MNIALRILVILILCMNGAALFFASKLSGKRDVLIDRANVLEQNIITVAKTFEASDPAKPAVVPEFTAKDVDDVTATQVETPTRSEFWDTYKYEYELTAPATFNIANRTADLRAVYALDAEGNPRLTAGRKNTADAPMQKVLDDVKARASAQFSLLNSIRAELKKVREELDTTIGQYNELKKDARKDKATLVELRAQIDQLNATIAELNSKIQTLTGTISSLENEKAEIATERDALAEKVETLEGDLADAKLQIEKLTIGTGPGIVGAVNLTAGVKGEVISSNNQLKFAIIRVPDEVREEFVGTAEQAKPLPTNELLVQHPGKADGIVGKLRMRMITANSNLIVCEILNDWQQDKIEPGDVVFYL